MAAQFAGNSRDQKSFDANAEKSLKQKGVTKNIAPDITPGSYQVPGLGLSRTLVKNIFKADLGDVLEPEKVGENYVVAIVTEINEEGKLSPAKARINIEPILRTKKIAEKLRQKAGNVTTLEAAAATFGGKPIETIDSLRMLGEQKTEGARAISSEPKVIGAAFNPSNRGKVVPQVIEGVSALFVVRVDNVMATSVADANIAEQRKTRKQQAQNRSPMQALRESATIKDRRINFF
jgi:peptidyl-prolyl cis-trans isomerase D